MRWSITLSSFTLTVAILWLSTLPGFIGTHGLHPLPGTIVTMFGVEFRSLNQCFTALEPAQCHLPNV